MTDLNTKETGGQFGTARVLPTFTIHQHANGTLFVTDDQQAGKWVSGGHATLASAVKIHQATSDRRTCCK